MEEVDGGVTYEGASVSPEINPAPMESGGMVMAPKHPHWRNNPQTKARMDSYSFQGDTRERLDSLVTVGSAHSDIGP